VRGMDSNFLRVCLVTLLATLTFPLRAPAQTAQPKEVQVGRVMGTVTDVNGEALVGATVVLTAPDPADRRRVQTNENGHFEIDGLASRVPYRVVVRDAGFADWKSPVIMLTG
jgi:hypothetical protein